MKSGLSTACCVFLPAMLLVLATASASVPAAADAPLPDPDRRLLSSGQTEGWRGNVALPAEGNGDDGDRVRGRLHEWPVDLGWPPASDADNVVVDPQTGLMWVRELARVFREPGSGPEGPNASMDWEAARRAVAALDYAGFGDWRLPNVQELQSLVDFGRALPAWEPALFGPSLDVVASPYFWTATTSPLQAEEAYYVNFVDGHAHPWHKAIHFSVRPVRDAGAADPVVLLKTGQTRSYAGTAPVEPPQGEDDGHLRRGWEPRYAWQDDGTIDRAAENLVEDLNTGLMWLRDPLRLDGRDGAGPGVGGDQDLSAPMDWQTALDRCAALDYGGHDDWRLPNVQELLSITQFGRADSPQDPAAFPNAPQGGGAVHDIDSRARWWSSTTSIRGKEGGPGHNEAWFVTALPPITRHHVNARTVPAKAHPGFVRCVRDAQPQPPPDGWRPEVRSSADWAALSLVAAQGGRLGKFLLAAGPAASPVASMLLEVGPRSVALPAASTADAPAQDLPFGAAFQDVSRFPLHLDFLRAAFPERFGALSEEDYTALAARRATRRLWAGGLRAFGDAQGRAVYGFDLYTDSADADELPRLEEVRAVCRALGRAFRRRPLAYSPTQPEAVRAAAAWPPLDCPLAFPQPAPDPGYTAYTVGEAYGTVRILSVDQLDQAVLSWQDIVVLDRAPTDLAQVVGAVLTGSAQGELSHLAVRSSRRGTPNAYLARAPERLRSLEGHLVRLTVSRAGWQVKADVDPVEAQAFWARIRPTPLVVPPPDLGDGAILRLEDLAAREAGGLRLVGAKAANLARLGPLLPEQNRATGLAIPFQHYDRFLRQNEIRDEALAPLTRTLDLHLAALLADPRFQTDPVWRAARLDRLRAAMRDGDSLIPDATVAAIAAAIRPVFGERRMVRFRSSSNMEDGLVFSGAGLYDSTSVCVADGEDGDSKGPSLCDPLQPEERTVRRGLRRVWASLWSERAVSERAWYGMDQGRAAMGILISPAFLDEVAQGVAFTGNPLSPAADELVVNVQPGDASVVLPEPGAVPERDVLEVRGGRVARIRREQSSSLLPPGAQVLSDVQLNRLGELLLRLRGSYAVDPEGHDPARIFLDLEFKLTPEDELVFKQVRPYLAADAQGRAAEGFARLELPSRPGPGGPAGLALCSAWREAEDAATEEADFLQTTLRPGELTLPLITGTLAVDLWSAPRLGPDAIPATAEGPGRLDIDLVAGRPELRGLRLSQAFRAGSQRLVLSLELPALRAAEPNLLRLDEATLIQDAPLWAAVDGRPAARLQPCALPSLPDERLMLDFGMAERAVLTLRYGADRGLVPYAPAALAAAWLSLGLDGAAEQTRYVAEPRHLVYDAGRHNWNEILCIRLEPPLGGASVLELSATGIPGRPDEGWSARLLDGAGGPGRELPVTGFRRLAPRAGVGRVWLPWGRAGTE